MNMQSKNRTRPCTKESHLEPKSGSSSLPFNCGPWGLPLLGTREAKRQREFPCSSIAEVSRKNPRSIDDLMRFKTCLPTVSTIKLVSLCAPWHDTIQGGSTLWYCTSDFSFGFNRHYYLPSSILSVRRRGSGHNVKLTGKTSNEWIKVRVQILGYCAATLTKQYYNILLAFHMLLDHAHVFGFG